jgi:hypothetical protein
MKVQSLCTLSLLATLGEAQSAQAADYRSLCPVGQDSGKATFDNGITAKYVCRVKATSDTEPTEVPAKSSQECAAQCGTGCSSAIWQYTRNRYLLYGSEVELSPHGRGSIYLEPTGRGSPVDPPDDDEITACEAINSTSRSNKRISVSRKSLTCSARMAFARWRKVNLMTKAPFANRRKMN